MPRSPVSMRLVVVQAGDVFLSQLILADTGLFHEVHQHGVRCDVGILMLRFVRGFLIVCHGGDIGLVGSVVTVGEVLHERNRLLVLLFTLGRESLPIL